MFQKSVAGKPVKSGMRGNFRTGVSVAVQRAESLRKGTRNQTANKQKPCRNFCTETSQEPTYERTRISRAESEIRKLVSTKRVVLFSSNNRKECAKLAEIFESIYVDIAIFELNELGERGRAIESVVRKDMNRRDFPAVFLNGTYFGDLEDVTQAEADGRLEAMVGTAPRTYDFDLFVIGGGSGGLAAAKEASNLEKRVGIADFVDPTPLGNSWGLGGTCINVGCIPKKLMHQAALYGDCLKIMAPYGWDVSVGKHKWSTLIENVQNYIKSLNWVTKKELKKKSVQFFKSHASILDPHTIELDTPNEPSRTVTARNILIAIGTRPRYPDIPNARELCITSDDIFSQKYPPGTTLVVGASYVGLECAGFLQSLGFNTTVLVRSRVLNGFDEQMANLVRHQMEDHGTKFLDGYVFAEIRRIADGKPPTLQVKMKREETGEEVIANYNTVLLAIGRLPQLKNLGTENLGIAVDTQSGRIIGDELERTSCRNVFVVGDALHGRPQLTPVAIHAGVLLARRLFAKSRETMNYDLVPTTVFTPLEYGSVGFSEEVAVRRFAPAVRVYHSTFTPYEHKLDTGDTNRSYAKIVCVQCPKGWRLGDPLEDFAGNDSSLERVVGFHLLSPSAGEITQGFGVAMRMGLTLQDLANSIGIHPTMAAIFLKLKVKREGDFGEEALCCN